MRSHPTQETGFLGLDMDSGGHGDTATPNAGKTETARYIAEMTQQMSLMAKRADLEIIAYLLELARLEAEDTAQKGELT